MPSEKDARMGGTLHNVKSVIDALSVGFLKPRKFQLCVKDNVRSECYGYAIMVSRGVHEGILYPQGTLFPEVRATYQRRQTFYKSASRLS